MGSTPSDYSEFGDFPVKLGIDSISLHPDPVIATTRRAVRLEARPQVRAARTQPATA